jgi:hydroxyacylglutathione hydrolase
MSRLLFRRFSDLTHTMSKIDIISAMVTDMTKHSLLDCVYIYRYFKHYYSYLILDKLNRSLVAFDCGDFVSSRLNIEKIMKETGASFDYLFITHSHEGHCAGIKEWNRIHPKLNIISGKKLSHFQQKPLSDGDIIHIGNLSVYCMHTPGHTDDSFSYVVHEITESSTKTPLLFSGDTLFIGGTGKVAEGKYKEMYDSLNKLKSLPNETLIFPGHANALENLTFAKMLEKSNPFLEQKLTWAKENKDKHLAPSIMSEERLYNPFLRTNQPMFKELTQEEDPLNRFIKLRKLMDKLIK